MKRLALFVVALTLSFVTGCGGSLDQAVDPAEADKALQTALGAWKSGKSPQDLTKARPSIIMNEDDWRVGKRLLDFDMEKGFVSGRQVRCRVRIKLLNKDDKAVDRNAVYIIDTIPQIVIVRDSFAS